MDSMTYASFVMLMLSALNIPASKASCPSGWVSRGRSCYYYNRIGMTWQNARTYCHGLGGDLVVIKDAGEQEFIVSMVNGYSLSSWVWIGLTDIAVEGTYVWVDGTRLIQDKSYWSPGEPNNMINEDCVHIVTDRRWNDMHCTYVMPFICEINIAPVRHINCTSNYMEIQLDKTTYNITSYESITLRDSKCKANQSLTHIKLGTVLTSCGTTKSENQTHIVYSNKVMLSAKEAASNEIITRDEDKAISFSCAYSKDGYASGASFVPITRVIANESGIGSFTFDLKMYQSSAYSIPYSVYPVQLTLEDNAYFQVKASVRDAELVLLINQCYSTQSANKNDDAKYTFINNGCPTDKTVKFYAADRSKQRFSIQAFRYRNNSSPIFFHCLVFLCQKTSSDSRCTTGCNGNNINRAKRDVSNELAKGSEHKSFSKYYLLEAGPIRVNGKKKPDNIQGKDDTQSSLKNTIIGFAIGVAVLVGLIAGLVVRLKRLQSTRYNPTLEVGLDNAGTDNVYVVKHEVEGKNKVCAM